jgi:cytoskeleton protein RodZ
MAEKKKVKSAAQAPAETVRPQAGSVGETLRNAREARGLEIEAISQAIHIRPVQLKAIEENDVDSLPGMTYAVGFVRSYANFLGLNGAEIVHRFKAEQGHSPAPSNLAFPEPIVESRVPDPMMVGVGAFLAVVILVVWTIYSNMSGGDSASTEVPPPPAEMAAEAEAPAPAMTEAADAPMTTVPEAEPSTEANALLTPAPAVSVPAAPAAPEKVETPAAGIEAKPEAADAAEEKEAAEEQVIKIKKEKSRITLKSVAASWVQVTDESGRNVLYRKVLRPGEQYSVPDQPGLVLDTANAGGLEVIVDGKTVNPLGKGGEILRGIELDPSGLKARRAPRR